MTDNITFDENKYKIKSRSEQVSQAPTMIKFLLNKGIVKTEKTAHALLASIVGLFLLASVYVFAVYVFDVNIGAADTVSPEQIQERQESKARIEQTRKQRSINTQNNQQ